MAAAAALRTGEAAGGDADLLADLGRVPVVSVVTVSDSHAKRLTDGRHGPPQCGKTINMPFEFVSPGWRGSSSKMHRTSLMPLRGGGCATLPVRVSKY